MKALMTVRIESDGSSAARSASVLQFVAEVNTCLSRVLNDGAKSSGDTKFQLLPADCICTFMRMLICPCDSRNLIVPRW